MSSSVNRCDGGYKIVYLSRERDYDYVKSEIYHRLSLGYQSDGQTNRKCSYNNNINMTHAIVVFFNVIGTDSNNNNKQC